MRRPIPLRHRGRSRRTGVWVLAMLCLRAFVPAGFMLAPVDGRLDLVLCDADAAGALHHHPGGNHASHHHTHLDSTCPYAQSAGPAPLPMLPALGVPPRAGAAVLPALDGQVATPFGPIRQHTSRGPPFLA